MATVNLYRLNDVDLTADEITGTVFSPDHEVEEIRLKPGIAARLFLSRTKARTPEWTTYLEQITEEPLAVNPRESAGAVLLLRAGARKKNVYAATWGGGHFLLAADKVQADVGLRIALNLLSAKIRGSKDWDPERVRAIRTKRVGETTLLSQTQASRKTSIEVFPLSIDADQLRQVTGTPTNKDTWGSNITGGVSIHVRRPDRAARLGELCKQLDKIYRSDDYKTRYGWVDNVAAVNNPKLLEKAVAELIKRLKSGEPEGISLAPPTLIEWDEVARFEYQWGRDKFEIAEPTADGFLQFVKEHRFLKELSPERLISKAKLNTIDDNGEKTGSWPLLRCFTAEFELDGDSYILDEGSLFYVDRDYLRSLNAFVAGISTMAIKLPVAKSGELEGPYNERLAETLKSAILLDKRTVTRPQTTAIEICDVALKQRKLIHVKKGLSSSSLSHLFAQGVVSAELLYMDQDFRKRVKSRVNALVKAKDLNGSGKKTPAAFGWLYESPFDANQCEVAYVVMTGTRDGGKTRALPFFSKVNLRQRGRELGRMGFVYSLTLVPSV